MTDNLPTKTTSFSPTNFEQAERFAALVAKTDFAPKEFRGNPGNVLVAMVFGSEIGLSPMQSLQNIAVINGKPSIYGDAALALVLAHQTCEYVNETYDSTSETATCKCKRRGKNEHVEMFSRKDAQIAGLWGKVGPWTQYPRRMLAMRARGFALRNIWPDVLKGIITREEAQDYPIVEAEYQLAEDLAKNANQPEETSVEMERINKAGIVAKFLDKISSYEKPGELNAWWTLNYKSIKSEMGDDPEGRGGGPEYKKLYQAMLAKKEELSKPTTPSPTNDFQPPRDPQLNGDLQLGENEVICPKDDTIKHKENDCIRGTCERLNTCEAWEQ